MESLERVSALLVITFFIAKDYVQTADLIGED